MDIDLQLFKNVIAEGRNNSDLLDSYSPNQFKTKERLIGHVRDLNVVNEQSEITILGGWYGSILIPMFKEVKHLLDPKKPLINRTNIVLTKNNKINMIQNYPNIKIYDNIEDTLKKYNNNSYYIGGSSIYNYLINNNLVTEAHISFINDNYNCDNFIEINKLREKKHTIISKQSFEKFTYMHLSFH